MQHDKPVIVKTVAELEALDPECLVYDSTMMFWQVQDARAYNEWGEVIGWDADYISDLPAVKVAEGAHLRACREALDGGEA